MGRPDAIPAVGEVIRAARTGRGIGLRELARRAGVAPSYLCDIELGRRLPTERVVRALAAALAVDGDALLARAGRIGAEAEALLRRSPPAARLIARIAAADPDEATLARVAAAVEEALGSAPTRPPRAPGP